MSLGVVTGVFGAATPGLVEAPKRGTGSTGTATFTAASTPASAEPAQFGARIAYDSEMMRAVVQFRDNDGEVINQFPKEIVAKYVTTQDQEAEDKKAVGLVVDMPDQPEPNNEAAPESQPVHVTDDANLPKNSKASNADLNV